MAKQIKSRKRVHDNGEVFTNKREVKSMLALVKSEVVNLNSKFLEPSCGNGNFLIEILRRKLNIVKRKFKDNQIEYEKQAFVVVSNLYGIDLLQDNVDETINRLFTFFLKRYKTLFGDKAKQNYIDNINYLFQQNIICGNAITYKNDKDEDLYFSDWVFTINNKLKRKCFYIKDLSDSSPKPFKEYPLTHYMKVLQYDK
jgi:hypothetical protein